jgi:hypothetical protein
MLVDEWTSQFKGLHAAGVFLHYHLPLTMLDQSSPGQVFDR